MRKYWIGAGLVALVGGPALALQAGDGPPPRSRPPETRAEAQAQARDRFAMLDTNHDGVITRDEFDAARAAMQARMAQRDGAPSDDAPPPPPSPEDRMAGGPRPGMGHGMGHGPGMGMGGHWFDRVDADHDGKVTPAEAESAAMMLFDMVDANHDGTISPEERHAARAFMRMGKPDKG